MPGDAARSPVAQATERDPLLPSTGEPAPRKRFYRPRPMWLVPFAVTASLVRGMTLAPRVQVYTQLSCQQHYHDYNLFNPTVPSASQPLSLSSPLASGSESTPSLISVVPYTAPPLRDHCLSDPAVQAGAARLQTTFMIVMGIASALSTGWWGHFGEKHGRMRVLAFSTLGLMFSDFTFALVSHPSSAISPRLGQVLLVLAPLFEGVLGGWSSLQGATSAYLSDCTSDGKSRSQVFSRFNGVFYIGFAVGPAIGAFIIRHPILDLGSSALREGTGKTVTSVFYTAAFCSFLNLLLVLFVFPESLNSKISPADLAVSATAPGEGEAVAKKSAWGEFVDGFSHVAVVFSPKWKDLPSGGRRRDWSLTLLATALFGYLLASGIFQIKYLYAGHVYGWGSEELSWYIFLAGGLRGLTLLFLVPFVISLFKPKRPDTAADAAPDANAAAAQVAAELRFDLALTRASLGIDLLSQTLVSLAPAAPRARAQALFVAFSVVSSLGAGAFPTVQSLALGLVKESTDAALRATGAGKVFGALAAVQAVAQMILGPLVFGTLYAWTVGFYPRAIFNFAAVMLFLALLCMVFLRAPAPPPANGTPRRQRRGRRGRSRTTKDLRPPTLHGVDESESEIAAGSEVSRSA